MSGPWKRRPVHPSVLVINYFLEKLHTLIKSNIWGGPDVVDQRVASDYLEGGSLLLASKCSCHQILSRE